MFFGGAPLWHASIALWSPLTGRPKEAVRWTAADREAAERAAGELLLGCGIPDRERADEIGGIAMHVRRQTTFEEQDYVFRKTPKGRAATREHAAGRND